MAKKKTPAGPPPRTPAEQWLLFQLNTADRDAGIAEARAHAAEDWKEYYFEDVLKPTAARLRELTADDLADHDAWLRNQNGGGPETHNLKTIGAIMLRGAREGIIVKTDRTTYKRRRTCHRCPSNIWRSLIYKGGTEC
jgi:hypothetical protein